MFYEFSSGSFDALWWRSSQFTVYALSWLGFLAWIFLLGQTGSFLLQNGVLYYNSEWEFCKVRAFIALHSRPWLSYNSELALTMSVGIVVVQTNTKTERWWRLFDGQPSPIQCLSALTWGETILTQTSIVFLCLIDYKPITMSDFQIIRFHEGPR